VQLRDVVLQLHITYLYTPAQICSMLTEKQIENIHKLDKETILEIMHECAEALGTVSVKEYCEIMQIARRTVYDYMERGKIKYFELSEHKFPIINSQ